ncbi:hypothetical protein DL98DRAFT_619661 [Cadophora sp. DSE1049]|nr:hypothetical protein DL98DRAFT_619661 [Cadophora sp. DSE1049]
MRLPWIRGKRLPQTTLCDFCQDMAFEYEADNNPESTILFSKWVNHQPSLEALRQSVSAGCHLCTQILFAFPPSTIAATSPSQAIRIGISHDRDNPKICVSLRIWCNVVHKLNISYPGSQQASSRPRDVLHTIGTFNDDDPENTHTGSARNLEAASRWLGDCVRNHQICEVASSSGPRLPNRVVVVGNESVPPRLIVSGGQYGQYAILSHCWGDSVQRPTTMRNLSERERNMPFGIMPRTFQKQ